MEDFLKDFYTVTIIRETLNAFKASVLEVVLLFSVILGLISLLVFVYVFQKKKKIAERKANSEELFQKGIKNPGKGFSKGDGVTLYVPLSMETHQLKSVIARISGNGKFLHLEFRDVRESDRDKIISYLFHR